MTVGNDAARSDVRIVAVDRDGQVQFRARVAVVRTGSANGPIQSRRSYAHQPCRLCTTATRTAGNDPPLPFPHSSQVDGQLRELRCHYGRDLYRILYQRSGNLFVLLHALEKRTGTLPQTDIDIAK